MPPSAGILPVIPTVGRAPGCPRAGGRPALSGKVTAYHPKLLMASLLEEKASISLKAG
jgi:hypothetical protein